MIAGDSKIWIMALFLLASYVYKAVKKKREQEKGVSEPSVEEEGSAESSWGMDDLIQEFEDSYGSNKSDKEPLIEQPELTTVADPSYNESSQRYKNPYGKEETVWDASKSALKQEKSTSVKTRSKSQVYEGVTVDETDYDLREMVISKVILDRPEY